MAKQVGYDLRLNDRFHAYGYVAPGYSFLNGLDATVGQGPETLREVSDAARAGDVLLQA